MSVSKHSISAAKWTASALAVLITATLAVAPAFGQRQDHRGQGQDRRDRVEERRDDARQNHPRRDDSHRDDARRNHSRQNDAHHDDRGNRNQGRLTPRAGVYFADKHRTHVREYYVKSHRRGHCPPGLAKRHNGCTPPGHARKWQIGRQLPRDVMFYDLPPRLVQEIGPPPPNYRYVRVATDILLIAIGSGTVFDAIQDLGEM
jgi:hypothetical protein